jgi:hypothetical protein
MNKADSLLLVAVNDCVESGELANLVDGIDRAWQQLYVIPRVVITAVIFVIVRFRRRRRQIALVFWRALGAIVQCMGEEEWG